MVVTPLTLACFLFLNLILDVHATAPRDGLEEGEVNPPDRLPGVGQPDLPGKEFCWCKTLQEPRLLPVATS